MSEPAVEPAAAGAAAGPTAGSATDSAVGSGVRAAAESATAPRVAPTVGSASERTALMAPAVEVRALEVRFGSVQAVADVDLAAYAGQGTALLGRNGAGKSTTMRVLAGVVPPTAGLARVAGYDVAADPMAARRATGYCPDVGGLVPRATPWEHLQLAARLRRMDDWEDRAWRLLDRFELAGVAHRVTGGFSHGMGRRLSVVLAAFHRPPVLLLDEPFDGVDPLGVEATLQVLADARADGACVLVSTHLRDLAAACCSTAVVLRGGARVATLAAEELVGEEGARTYRALLD